MPAAFPAAIGVDVGTTNTKVVLASFDDGGAVREERVRTVPTPTDGAALQDAVLTAIGSVASDAQGRLIGIGVASMAETGSLVDADGGPLGELLRWNEKDGGAAVRSLVAGVGAAELYAATGVPVPEKTPLAHWLTLAEAGDARLSGARWAGVADLVVAALVGEAVTDHTLAARTMAYRLGEPAERFDADLLGLVGLTPDRFPRVVRPGESAGALTADAAAVLGLPAGMPVVAAGHDHAVGAWAAGVREPGPAADSVGTTEALYRLAAEVPREAARENGMSIARAVDGIHESLLGANPTAGALVEWALHELLPGVDRADVFAAAAACSNAAPACFLLPYLRGRQAPRPDRSAHLRAVPAMPADPGAALTAVLTGLVLQLAWLDSAQCDILGARDADLAVLAGPGAANDAWWNLKRRILTGRLRRVEAAEPVATGAAMLAAHRVAGITTTLPLGDASPASDGEPELLAAFIDAAIP
ncbi:FGGY-family carbohydrate kinase [Humibacter sp.]|uniref:FGGY-family carbohydrate kinase n=1 Tax=Humibacter sp. TaxID=1940291 RepID=UPI003F7F20EC